MGKGWHTHRDGGTDPTELLESAQPGNRRPNGACNTALHHAAQPDVGSLEVAPEDPYEESRRYRQILWIGSGG
jgi:hypothetical protein